MRWSRVRIAHDPPQRPNKKQEVIFDGDLFFYARHKSTNGILAVLVFIPPSGLMLIQVFWLHKAIQHNLLIEQSQP